MYINWDINMPIKVKDVSGCPLVPVPGHNGPVHSGDHHALGTGRGREFWKRFMYIITCITCIDYIMYYKFNKWL